MDVTERRPPDETFETWVDRQIREATERGAFDHLPGAGKPIPDLDRPHDEQWWVKRKLRRENADYLPPTLAVRKEAEDALNAAYAAATEDEVRRIVAGINEVIVDAIKRPLTGPPLGLVPLRAERVVEEWRQRRGLRGNGERDAG